MILDGIVLGLGTLGVGTLTYSKLPEGVKAWVVRHPLLVEVGMTVIFYEVMGMTLVAHVACATMIAGSIALMHMQRNKQDYQFLFDAVDEGKKKLNGALAKLRDMNKEHMERKKLEAAVAA